MFVDGQTLRIKPTMIQDIDGVNFFTYKWYQSDNGKSTISKFRLNNAKAFFPI